MLWLCSAVIGISLVVIVFTLRSILSVKVIPAVKAGPKPFQSYREFCDAKDSMELEVFLDQAYVTPESVKRPPESFTMPHRVGAGGNGEVAGNGGAGGDGFDSPYTHNLPSVDAGPGYKVGKWYRDIKSHGLYQLALIPYEGASLFTCRAGISYRKLMHEVAIAYPMGGEIWIRTRCDNHPVLADEPLFQPSFRVMSIEYASDPCGLAVERSQLMNLCGCLRPSSTVVS